MSSWWGSVVNATKQISKSLTGETSALHSVADEAITIPYTLSTRSDLEWRRQESSCVETQTFYIFTPAGHVVMVQIIYSNVYNTVITSQLSTKIFYPKAADGTQKEPFWKSESLSDYTFSDDKTGFECPGKCLVELNEAGDTFKVKCDLADDGSACEIEITRGSTPAFKIGKDGASYFGDDLEAPDGCMRHVFWPRSKATGTITTKDDGNIDLTGTSVFIHALQGMLPNHIASSWNFITCHTPTYSAIQMEFTAPPSYNRKVVTVGGIVTDDSIILAGGQPPFKHTEINLDAETGWSAPTSLSVEWVGKGQDDKVASASLEGSLGPLASRIDVFNELPSFLKSIMASVLGTKPYLYQYHYRMPLQLTIGTDEDKKTITEEATIFCEASFILQLAEPEVAETQAEPLQEDPTN